MKHAAGIVALVAGLAWPPASNAEILAMVNYESKSADALKAFKSPVPGATRTEGIAVDRRRSGLARVRQDRRDHPFAGRSRRASHFL